ncbi:hypothetical protein [Kiloniella sp.]|uniref:hypothetical protein n=1 Tax=Kiloniella sp. TaxID=1938587 RepID=UPI003A956266
MNIDKLISRATHTTGRSLCALSSIIILFSYYNYPLNQLPVIGGNDMMPDKMIESAGFGMLAFLSVTHILNWYTDYIAYQASFPLNVIKSQQDPTVRVTEKSTGEKWEEQQTPIIKSNWAQKISLFGQHLLIPLTLALITLIIL